MSIDKELLEQGKQSDKDLRDAAQKQLGKKNERPMGMVDMDAIKSVMRGETPTFSVSMYESTPSAVDEEKEGRHKVLHELRKELNPTFCPKCGGFMDKNYRLNMKFFRLRGWCFNCNLKFERKIRDAGLWETFEACVITGNKVGFLEDVKRQADDFLNIGLKKVNEFVDSDGHIEKWTNNEYEDTKKYVEEQLVEINGFIDDLSEYYEELKEKLGEYANYSAHS